jgi:hypothetical protein
MNTFTADSSLGQSLSSLSGLTEVRDAHGKVLGFFSPTCHPAPEAYARAAAHFDPQEMKRRKASNEAGRETGDVLNRLTESDE